MNDIRDKIKPMYDEGKTKPMTDEGKTKPLIVKIGDNWNKKTTDDVEYIWNPLTKGD